MSKRPRDPRQRRRTPSRHRDLLRLTSATVVAVTAVGVLSIMEKEEQGFEVETVAAPEGRGSAALDTSSTLGEDGEESPDVAIGDPSGAASPEAAGGPTSSPVTGPDPDAAPATGQPRVSTPDTDDVDGDGHGSSALGAASVGGAAGGDAVPEPEADLGDLDDRPAGDDGPTGTPDPSEQAPPPAPRQAEESAASPSGPSAPTEPDESDAVSSSTPATTTTTAPPTTTTAAPTTTTTTAPTTTTTAPTTTTTVPSTTTTIPTTTTTAAPTTTTAANKTGSGGAAEREDAPADAPTAAQWAALRACESDGDYTVVSGNGRYFGAYQFHQSTWDGLARISGRSEAVGQPPNEASPALQDAMARLLWQRSGPGQWPVCGDVLTDGG